MDLTGHFHLEADYLLLKRIFQSIKDSKCVEARGSMSLNPQSLPHSWSLVNVWCVC